MVTPHLLQSRERLQDEKIAMNFEQNHRYHRKNGRRMALGGILLLSLLVGCSRNGASSPQKGIHFPLEGGNVTEVKAYFYQRSAMTDQLVQERSEFLRRKIRELTDTTRKRPNYFQESNQKIAEIYRREMTLMTISTNWPIVFVERVMLQKETPSRYICLLRNVAHPIDIVLTISSSNRMEELQAYDLVASAIKHLDTFTIEHWTKIRPGKQPLFGADLTITAPELQPMFEGSTFIGPPK